MEVKPGYKQTEVGVIPEEWEVDALGRHVEIKSGESPSLFLFKNEGIPYFKVEQLNNNSKYLSDTPYFILGDKKIPRGSLIFPKRGASILLNKVRILKQDSFMDTNMMTLTPKVSLDHEYLYYELIHIELWRIADTTSIPQINNKHIIPLVIPLPTIEEQHAIAEALSDVDSLIGSLNRLIAKKRDLKQATMQQLLTGQTRLPGFHGEWETKTIGDYIDLLTGFPFLSNKYSEAGVRLLRGSNVKRGETDWAEDIVQYWPSITPEIERYQLQSGDLVIAMDGSLVGRSYARLKPMDLPAVLLQRVARIRSKTIDIGFLTQVVGSERFINYCDSIKTVTAIPHISSADIRTFKMPLPPTVEEQTVIAAVLSDMDAEIAALEARRDKTRALKQGMMQELLTGKTRLI